MSDGGSGTRPGGLTALAVLNFVFGGVGLIVSLLMLAVIGHVEQRSGGEVSEAVSKSPEAAAIILNVVLGCIVSVLLIVSGIGYLGQKRVMGRTMGNAYGVLSILSSIVGILMVGFGFMSIIGFVYPVLTLALLNGTFKEDLVH